MSGLLLDMVGLVLVSDFYNFKVSLWRKAGSIYDRKIVCLIFDTTCLSFLARGEILTFKIQ